MKKVISISSLVLVVIASALYADGKSSKEATKNSRVAKKAKSLPGVTPEREAAAMTFVRQHHPELANLLVHLKDNLPRDYQRAVRELFSTSERLARIQERGDAEGYELELKIWQAKSRKQLLAARLTMQDDGSLRQQLRDTLNEQADLQLQLLAREKARLQARIEKIDAAQAKFTKNRAQSIDRQIRQLTKGTSADENAVPTKAGSGKTR